MPIASNLRDLVILLLALVAGASSAPAQGYIYTWHGFSHQFQATFQVTDAEQQGAAFLSPVFFSSIAVTDPDKITYHFNPQTDGAFGGAGPPLVLGLALYDNANLRRIDGNAASGSGSIIREFQTTDPNAPPIYSEMGFWTFAQVPEPSCISLLLLGAILRVRRRRRGCSC
jgi:hypothetical protein